MILRSWCWPPFGFHFGGILGAQMGAKAFKKALQKNIKQTVSKMSKKWSQRGPKMEPKSSKMRSWKHLVSRVAPKRPPEPLQDRFWRGVGTILGPCSWVFLTYFLWFLHTVFSSMLQTTHSKEQGITKRIQQRASKKQLLSSCHLALNSSLANVNELSGPC